MGKYLFQSTYSQAGLQGVLKEGAAARRDFVHKVVNDLGGSVEAFYWAFGDVDVVVVADLPDDETAAALSFAIASAGVGSVKTTVLLEAATVDAAASKTTGYRPPGGS